MLSLIRWLFTWWNGATMGTHWTVWRSASHVGTDDMGNKYFEETKARGGYSKRRWVIYDGLAEGSKVPAQWHGWLHHTVNTLPTDTPHVVKEWERPHEPNFTGTDNAYRPKGSLAGAAARPKSTGDYEAWQPEEPAA